MLSVKFNTKIYKKEAIRQAISAYSHLARFKVSYNKNYIKVGIGQIEPQFKYSLADEFSNYILGLTKKCL